MAKVKNKKLLIPNPQSLTPNSWFTEGFDTVYLKETEALLEELSRAKSVILTHEVAEHGSN